MAARPLLTSSITTAVSCIAPWNQWKQWTGELSLIDLHRPCLELEMFSPSKPLTRRVSRSTISREPGAWWPTEEVGLAERVKGRQFQSLIKFCQPFSALLPQLGTAFSSATSSSRAPSPPSSLVSLPTRLSSRPPTSSASCPPCQFWRVLIPGRNCANPTGRHTRPMWEFGPLCSWQTSLLFPWNTVFWW